MNGSEQISRIQGEFLVVEDSPTQRELVKHILEEHGCNVVTARNGREALEMIGRCKPVAIISDVIMPEMDGFELCSRIRRNPATGEVPVILLTSLSDPEDVIQGLESGADNFVAKPFDKDYLWSRIEYILANRSQAETQKGSPVRVSLAGRIYEITAGRRQILDLLLSTYEAAFRKNEELFRARDELASLNEELERKVEERTATLRESLKSVESLCYTMAHDLRAPLRAMQGFTTALSEDYTEQLDDTAKDYARRIRESAERMDHLIHDLLLYGRLSHQELPTHTIRTTDVVEKLLDRMDEEIKEKHAAVSVRKPLPEVRANEMVLEQVLTNLIGNALKFVAPGMPPNIEISGDESDDSVRLSVKDFGIGFLPAHRNRIFDPFERLHPTYSYPGTGIGLAIVRKGVERMGGKSGADSEPGKGSEFWIELPKG